MNRPIKSESKMTILEDGTQEWSNGSNQLHRLDGPALIHPDGRREWYHHGFRYRLDGPAVIYGNGYMKWCQNNSRHRTDGPAVIWNDGSVEYWDGDRPLRRFNGRLV